MLLRKYLEGARIETIAQPRWERVLELTAGHRISPESNERVRYRLIIEIMGRLSNIILCDEHDLILGSLKRVGPEINRYRTIAANVQYVPPPPQQRTLAGQTMPKLEPTTVDAAQLELCARDKVPVELTSPEKARKRPPEPPKLWQLLTRHLLGFSPLIAREAVYRTTGNAETLVENVETTVTTLWEELARNVRELSSLYDNHPWQPQLVERLESLGLAEQATPLAFAPYRLEQYAHVPGVRVHQSPSMNVLLDDYYARTEWRDAMESVRTPIRKVLQTQRDRCRRKFKIKCADRRL